MNWLVAVSLRDDEPPGLAQDGRGVVEVGEPGGEGRHGEMSRQGGIELESGYSLLAHLGQADALRRVGDTGAPRVAGKVLLDVSASRSCANCDGVIVVLQPSS